METWKAIPGYEGLYEISTCGKVKTLNYRRTGKIKELKFGLNTGYLCVILYKQGKRKLFRVHVLIAMTFLDFIPDGYKLVVDHINNNPLDNRLQNLQMVTVRKNTTKDRKRDLPTGVTFLKKRKKYWSRITINGECKNLGYYKTSEEASKVYQKFLKQNNIK